jgi:hypothetical protein
MNLAADGKAARGQRDQHDDGQAEHQGLAKPAE